MKKILSVMVAALMCFSSIVPALADDGDTAAKLILAAKEKFSISDDEFVFNNYSKDDYNGEVTYYLNWKSKEDNDYKFQPSISVRIQEDGDIELYRKSHEYTENIKLPDFTEEEIITKAKEHISKIAPDRAESVNLGEVLDSTQYTVHFERLVNGIPVMGDCIEVDLNPNDLSVDRYSAQWTETEFPSPEGIIDIEEAREVYREKIGYSLLYNLKTKDYSVEDIYLSYESNDSSAVIDAFSGEATNHMNVIFGTSGGGAMQDNAAAETANLKAALSPEEQKAVDEINLMITKEDAEKIARGIPEFKILKDAEVSSYSVSKNQYGDYIAHIRFSKNVKDDYYSASLSINAKTKEITSFSSYRDAKNTKNLYDAEKAKKNAESFLNKYYADKMKEVKPEFSIGEGDKYSFRYDRVHNGTAVNRNGISLSVNQYTGDIEYFNCTWPEVQFPGTEDAVSSDAIYSKVLAADNFRLQYVTTTNYLVDEKTGKETRESTANLVYAALNSPIYGVKNGEEIDGRGERIVQKFAGYTDIDGHYCENAATELGRIGIYFEGEALNPDQKVTQAEFLKFMYRVMYGYYYSDGNKIYKQLIFDGILEEDEISENVSRIQGIKYFINALGYKEVAQLTDIFKPAFNDVDSSMTGYAAIAGGLGIINGDAKAFRPDDLMTRAECLTIIHNYLK